MIPGTYHNGFAPRDGEPLYPQLWRGCVGAWCPSLGPSGLTLRDWGGRQRHGTLNSGATWSTLLGLHAITLDGSTGSITTVDSDWHTFVGDFSWSLWAIITKTDSVLMAKDASGNREFQVYYDGSNKLQFLVFDNGTASYLQHNTDSAVSVNVLHHLSGVFSSGALSIYVDGASVAGTTTPTGSFSQIRNTASHFTIGAYGFAGSRTGGTIDDVRLYSRALASNEIRLLSGHRGIAYAMRDDAYSRSAARIPSGATMTGGMYTNQCGGFVA